jgi:hypothetical protein
MTTLTALKWALERIRFPEVPDPKTPNDDHLWTGCPGCRVVWTRDMQHKDGCEYLAALACLASMEGNDQ